jgi:WD40 repeat protein
LIVFETLLCQNDKPSIAEGRCRAFAPDRKSLVSTGQDNALRVWDRIAGQQLRQSTGVTNLLAFSPDGKTVALTTTRNTIELSDFATGKQRLVFPGSERLQGTVRLGGFSPDGRTLYGVSLRQGPDTRGPRNGPVIIDGTLHFWDVVTGKEARQVSIGQFCYGVAFSPDRRSLAVIDHEATVHVMELATGKQRHEFRGMGPAATFAADGKGLTGIGYSPDGRTLAIWRHRRGLERSPAKTQLLDAATGKERRKIEGAGGAVAFSPDGRTLVAVKDDHQTLGLWDVLTGKEVRAFEGHRSVVNCVAFAPDAKTLASGSDDTAILVWDVATLLRGESASQRPDRPKTAELSPKELGLLWADLGGAEVPRAFQAVLTLADAPAQAVPFLRERVQPAVMKLWPRFASAVESIVGDASPFVRWRCCSGKGRKHHGTASARGCLGRCGRSRLVELRCARRSGGPARAKILLARP